MILSLLLGVGSIGFAIWTVARGVAEHDGYSRERCRKFRREFFEACLAAEPRYRCEVQWAQLGGKVFDSDPAAPWSDQLDCSKEFQ
jgi:hypothetical protein